MRYPELRSFRWPLTVVLVFGLLPVSWRYGERSSYGLEGPFGAYTYLLSGNSVLPLIFPLVAILPYAVSFTGKINNRYLTYARARASVRELLGREMFRCWAVTFCVFAAFGILPQLFVEFGDIAYSTEDVGPEGVAAYEQRYHSFGQFLPYGQWAAVIAYSGYLALTASLYAVLALCSAVVVRNRVLGLALPWMAYFATMLAMALFWLDAYSPALAYPFSLTQLPLGNFAYPLSGLLLVTAVTVGAVVVRAPKLPSLQ